VARDRKLRLDRSPSEEPVVQLDHPRGRAPERLDPKDQQGILWQRGPNAT